MTRLEINPELCSGHGRCYTLFPDLFVPDDYGHGQVIPGVSLAGGTVQEEGPGTP